MLLIIAVAIVDDLFFESDHFNQKLDQTDELRLSITQLSEVIQRDLADATVIKIIADNVSRVSA